jgi:hypothetical protein
VKDQAELDRALNVTRSTKGVKRVVSHLQINPDTQHTVTSPGGSGASNTTSVPASASSGSASTSNQGSGGEVYTGPVYTGGSIQSSPNTPASGGY